MESPTWLQNLHVPEYLKKSLQDERLASTKRNIYLLSLLLFIVGVILLVQHLFQPVVPESTPIWWWYFGAFTFIIVESSIIALITQMVMDRFSSSFQHFFIRAVGLALLLTTTGLCLLDLQAGNDLSVYLVGIFLLAAGFRLGKRFNSILIVGSTLILILAISLFDFQVNLQMLIALIIYAVLAIWMTLSLENQRVENLVLRTELKDRNSELEQISNRDSLTGAYNRRAFFEHTAVLAEQCKRYGTDLSIAILDIDKFKRVNDTLGHAAGDQVLKKIAERLIQATRSADITSRYGGEEFIVAMSNTHLKYAITVADRLRKEIEYLKIPDVDWTITISVGVAMYRPASESFEETLIRADQAMYQAKAEGGNTVSAARLESGNKKMVGG